MQNTQFQQLKEKAAALKAAYYAGAGETKLQQAREVARQAVEIYNTTAREVAKRHNRTPKLTNVDSFLRDL